MSRWDLLHLRHSRVDRAAYPHCKRFSRSRSVAASAKRASRKGIAMFEFAFILVVVILPLLIGMFEIGRLIHVCQVMTAGAREGGRQVAAGMPFEDVPAVVTEYISNALGTEPAANVEVQTFEVDVDFANAVIEAYGVSASIPMEDVSWLPNLHWFTDPAGRITVRSVWPYTELEEE